MLNLFFKNETAICKINNVLRKIGNCGISKSPYFLLQTAVQTQNHFPTIINLTNIDKFGETVHPDVIYIENGFGINDWKYFMSITRYPAGNDFYENPEFLVSDEGINWDIPSNAKSPVISAPSDWLGYNSDPSLLFDGNRIYLFYRKSLFNNSSICITIYSLYTEDGIHWSIPVKLFSKNSKKNDAAKLMSPTVLNFNHKYTMWYIDNINDDYSVYKSESYDLINWTSPEIVLLPNIDAVHPWHIDVIEKDGIFYMALSVLNIKTKIYSIYKSISTDQGITWFNFAQLIAPCYAFEERGCYRGSLVFVNKYLYLYYTGIDKNYTYSTAVTKINYM